MLAHDGPLGLEIDWSSVVEVNTTELQELPTWSHDGLEIAYLAGGGESWGKYLKVLPLLVTANDIVLLEDEVHTLAHHEQGIDHRPTWSPNDSWIAYCARVGEQSGGGAAFDLFRIRTNGEGAQLNVTSGSARPTFVDWNPLWIDDFDGP
jgi:Tol biopolymer transport system component